MTGYVLITEAIDLKKILTILLSATALLALSACGGASISDDTGDEQNTAYAGNSGSVQMPNPLMLSTLEEIEELEGVSITLPDSADSVTAIRINTDPIIDSVTFGDGGLRYVYRVSKTGELEDISGMYYDWVNWDVPEGGELPKNAPRCFTNSEGQGVMLWYRDGHSFSLAMTEGAGSGILTDMYKKLDDGTSIHG